MSSSISTIYLPVRPQVDTTIAIFLLKAFGEETHPGIKEARVEVAPVIEKRREDAVYIDVGGGDYDHHEQGDTATSLVIQKLGLQDNPALKKLIDIAERDDKEGKGIVSRDPLDRAFGFPGLLMALNKTLPDDPHTVISYFIPLLWGHYTEEYKRTVEIPREYEELKKEGKLVEFDTSKGKRSHKVVVVESSNTSLPGWLRSRMGVDAHVVCQRVETGHTNILTKQSKNVNLAPLAGKIRAREIELHGGDSFLPPPYLEQPGRIDEAPMWYYDTATNSLLNGGSTPGDTEATKISLEEIIRFTKESL